MRVNLARCVGRLLGALLASWPAAAVAESPRVVVSLKPLHSLVAGVMSGAGTPALLLDRAGSPHAFQLRPSDAARLQDADLVFWAGEELEVFLARSLTSLASRARVVALVDAPEVEHLATRVGGDWAAHRPHQDTHESSAGSGVSAATPRDMHLWLNVRNAARMSAWAAEELIRLDAENAAVYRANSQRLQRRLEALDEALERRLSPLRDMPFVVFHDAYQHLEYRYGLYAVGSVMVSPQRMPSAKRLRELRAKIIGLGARCVFREPQFESALVATVIEGTGASVGVLDPLGAQIEAGPEAYFELMRGIGEAIAECLS